MLPTSGDVPCASSKVCRDPETWEALPPQALKIAGCLPHISRPTSNSSQLSFNVRKLVTLPSEQSLPLMGLVKGRAGLCLQGLLR